MGNYREILKLLTKYVDRKQKYFHFRNETKELLLELSIFELSIEHNILNVSQLRSLKYSFLVFLNNTLHSFFFFFCYIVSDL